MTFLEYINERKNYSANLKVLNEGFQNKQVDKALKLITDLFKKNIDGKVIFDKTPLTTIVGKEKCLTYTWIQNKKGKIETVWSFNFKVNDKSSEVYSIDFFDAEGFNKLMLDPKGSKSNLSIMTMGSSVAYFLPICYQVVNNHDWTLKQKEAVDVSHKIFKESVDEYNYWIGSVEYNVYENLTDEFVNEVFNYNLNITETKMSHLDPDAKKFADDAWNKKGEAYRKQAASGKAEDIQNWRNLVDDYKKISKAIEGGATTLSELQMAIKKGVPVKLDASDLDKQEKSFRDNIQLDIKDPKKGEPTIIDLGEEDEHKTPEQVWKEMRRYIKLVIKGLQPSLIICGAPGVGKTYKVKQVLKAAGYKEDFNMFTFKGRGGAQGLYSAFYNFRNKGEIVMIDDCDSLLSDENAINIFKGALDSTSDDEGRLISYAIRGKVLDIDGNEIPKKCYYNGGCIILTNFQAGQLDTALRGRSFVQDIHFTVEDTLSEIKRLMPEIEPHLWGMKAKTKAYNYLAEVASKQKNMVLSLRTFGLCAKIYQSAEGDDDCTEDDCMSMIKEQMKMQAMVGGKKY